ncbi:MAG: hypothetical protein NT005_11980, partial [Spirochaetes bacterium]|nr:hypothetical protein [Spirochaetota bacterium]
MGMIIAKSKLVLFSLAFLACQGAFGQVEGAAQPAPMLFSLTLTPSVTVPLGRDVPYYNLGFGTDISADFRMPFFPLWFVSGNVGYSFVPLETVTSLSLLSGGVGTGLRFDSGKLCVKVLGTGGYFYGFLNDGTSRGGANPFATGGASISWAFTPSLSAGLGATYRYFFGLYNDLSIQLGGSYSFLPGGGQVSKPSSKPAVERKPLPAKPEPIKEEPVKVEPQRATPKLAPGAGLEVSNVEFFNVFPVF